MGAVPLAQRWERPRRPVPLTRAAATPPRYVARNLTSSYSNRSPFAPLSGAARPAARAPLRAGPLRAGARGATRRTASERHSQANGRKNRTHDFELIPGAELLRLTLAGAELLRIQFAMSWQA